MDPPPQFAPVAQTFCLPYRRLAACPAGESNVRRHKKPLVSGWTLCRERMALVLTATMNA
jgi:hypothetical protein